MDWKTLTVNQYEQLNDLYNLDRSRFTTNAIEVLFGVKKADVSVPLAEYNRLLGELAFFSTPMPKGKIKNTYTLNGREYVVDLNLVAFSAVQYQDLMQYAKGDKRLSDMLSCVVVPKGHKYNDGYDLEQAKEDIGSMGVVDGTAITAFFFTYWKAFTRTFRDSLLPRLLETVPKEKREAVEKKMSQLLGAMEVVQTMG